MTWKKFNGEVISMPIKEYVKRTIEEQLSYNHKLKVCIGTDSSVKLDTIEFATVIVFLRHNNGGFMFVNNEKTKKNLQLKERMMLEVSKSIEIAYELCELFIAYDIEMEVHADINTNPQFKSNDALRDAMGYITGMGFSFKAKPDAFASTYCADKAIN